jgi:hypothetical protein
MEDIRSPEQLLDYWPIGRQSPGLHLSDYWTEATMRPRRSLIGLTSWPEEETESLILKRITCRYWPTCWFKTDQLKTGLQSIPETSKSTFHSTPYVGLRRTLINGDISKLVTLQFVSVHRRFVVTPTAAVKPSQTNQVTMLTEAVLLEKLEVVQLVKKSPVFYGTES